MLNWKCSEHTTSKCQSTQKHAIQHMELLIRTRFFFQKENSEQTPSKLLCSPASLSAAKGKFHRSSSAIVLTCWRFFRLCKINLHWDPAGESHFLCICPWGFLGEQQEMGRSFPGTESSWTWPIGTSQLWGAAYEISRQTSLQQDNMGHFSLVGWIQWVRFGKGRR